MICKGAAMLANRGGSGQAGSFAVECGDLSPLFRFADLSAKRSRVQRLNSASFSWFDGDKSPAESDDTSSHAKSSSFDFAFCCGVRQLPGAGC
jgi:hypothetical protein